MNALFPHLGKGAGQTLAKALKMQDRIDGLAVPTEPQVVLKSQGFIARTVDVRPVDAKGISPALPAPRNTGRPVVSGLGHAGVM